MDELVKQPTNVYIIVHTHAQGTHLHPLPIKYPEQVPTPACLHTHTHLMIIINVWYIGENLKSCCWHSSQRSNPLDTSLLVMDGGTQIQKLGFALLCVLGSQKYIFSYLIHHYIKSYNPIYWWDEDVVVTEKLGFLLHDLFFTILHFLKFHIYF